MGIAYDRDFSDDNGKKADFSPSRHKNEMLEHKYNDDDDGDGAFLRLSQRDCPNFIHLLLVTTQKMVNIAETLSENPPN